MTIETVDGRSEGAEPDRAEGQGPNVSAAVAWVARHLPRGNLLDDESWHRRHRLLQWVLGVHVPALLVLGIALGGDVRTTAYLVIVPVVLLAVTRLVHRRRLASVLVTAGLTYCSAVLVVISHGAIEAHFHFFVIIGFIALYQDWVPFGYNIAFTVISHGLGSAWQPDLFFEHTAGQQNPWLWSGIHGVAVLAACVGVVFFWSLTEDEQRGRMELTRRLAESEVAQEAATREGVNAVFLNIAHRSQAIVHRQLQVLDQAERAEDDPDQLGLLFQLDHLTTRERRNSENLIILGGGTPGRQWRNPVPLPELVRSAVAETEQYTRVTVARVPSFLVAGHAVADVIHLVAELMDNATSFSPPGARIEVHGNRVGKGVVLEIEDQGLGIEPERMEQLNDMLRRPPEFGPLTQSQDWRLGLFVVTRLAHRHGIGVTLVESAYGGVRAVVLLPTALVTEPTGNDLAGAAPPAAREVPSPRRRPLAIDTAVDTPPVDTPPADGPTVDTPPVDVVASVVAPVEPDAPVEPAPATARPVGPAVVRPAAADIVAGDPGPEAAGPQDVPRTREAPAGPTPGRPGLPSRRRQAHVAAQLRDEPSAAAADDPAGGPSAGTDAHDRSADVVRARMAALQRGNARARGGDGASS